MGNELSYGLAGRRAIVTGHRGGIGGAVFDTLTRDGVEVIGLDLPDFDLSDTATLESRLATLLGERGPVDILVNNAGVTVLGTVLETSLAETERVFRVNFLAAYALMRAVLPGMVQRRKGAIVNITQGRIVGTDKKETHFFAATYTVDASKKPMRIDMKTIPPERPAGTAPKAEPMAATGLVKKEGDTLTIVYALPGGKPPTDFKTGEKQQMFVMKTLASLPKLPNKFQPAGPGKQ